MLRSFLYFLGLVFLGFAVSCSSPSLKKEKTAQLHLRLGVSQINQGAYRMALRELGTAKKLDPQNAVIRNNLGLLYFLMEQTPLAEAELKKAVKLSPKYSEARNNLARVLIERKKFKEAQEQIKKVLKDLVYPFPEKAWENLGILEFERKNYKLAIKHFSEVIKLKPNHCVGYYMKGRSFYEMKSLKKSLFFLNKSIKLCNLSFAEPYYYSGLVYYALNQNYSGRKRFQELLKKFPNSSLSETVQKIMEKKRVKQGS